jgi:hypothetical protein
MEDIKIQAKPTVRQKAKQYGKEGVKTAFWVGVIQLAIEVVKLISRH